MPRPHRDVAPGIFHVYAHSVRSTDLFCDDVDRLLHVEELAAMAARFEWKVIEVCLMTTHYHLIVEIEDASLALGMHRLNFRYACRFNSRHRLRGHVLESRYSSVRIRDDAHLVAAYAYVARNPVEAGLCKFAEDWPWSSFAALIQQRESFTFVDASRVLDWFGNDREQLRRYVAGHEVLPFS